MMVNSCCVVGCTNRYAKGAGISFHVFPCDEKRKALWIQAIRRKNWTPSPYSVICGKHFQTGRPKLDEKHPDYVPNLFPFSKGKVRSAENYEMYKKFNGRILLAKEVKMPKKNCEASISFQTPTVVLAGENGLKRRILKKNAIPSLNLPTSPEYTEGAESNNLKLVKNKRLKSKKKIPVNKGMSFEMRKLLFLDESNSNESTGNREEIENKLCSSSADDDEPMVASPYITTLRVMTSNHSAVDANSSEHTPENLEKHTENCIVPLLHVKNKENSDFDFSSFNSSPDDSKEILTQKLKTMISVNGLLQKKIKFYQNKCKMYEKEVNIMKGVIENLKLINSVTFDN